MTNPELVPWTAFDDGEIYAGEERIGAMTTIVLAKEACAAHNAALAASQATERVRRAGAALHGLTGVQIGDGGTQINRF